MTPTPRLTAAYLRTLGACSGQVDRFETRWPGGVAVTAAVVREARAAGLDVAWLCTRLERSDLWKELDKVRAAYNHASSVYGHTRDAYASARARAAYGRVSAENYRVGAAFGRARAAYARATPLACARLIRKHLRKGGAR